MFVPARRDTQVFRFGHAGFSSKVELKCPSKLSRNPLGVAVRTLTQISIPTKARDLQ